MTSWTFRDYGRLGRARSNNLLEVPMITRADSGSIVVAVALQVLATRRCRLLWLSAWGIPPSMSSRPGIDSC